MKILVIRFSSIGDIVLTTPVVRCLNKQVPGARVHYLTKKKFRAVLEGNPHLERFYTIEKHITEVAQALIKEDYDFIVDLHHNLRSAQVKSILRKRSASFSKLNVRKWLMVNLRINRLPDQHLVDRYFDTVKKLSVKNDGMGLDYFIPDKDVVLPTSLPEPYQKGFIGFVIGAKHFTKQLPKEKIRSIILKLKKPVVLLGGMEDAEKGNWIAQETGALNTCGKYNLNQSASLVRMAEKIITHDTGLMHIAAAFKKEIVSVWGNTVPAFGMYPYYGEKTVKNFKAEVQGLSCRPCSKIGFPRCPKKHFRCMNNIDEASITDFISGK